MTKPATAILLLLAPALAPQDKDDPARLVSTAVRELLKMEEEGGAWPYEGVYRVSGEIPAGYRVGGTALAAGALLHAAPGDPAARAAIERGLAFVLKGLDDPRLASSVEDQYDVRVWAHACALEFFCHLRAAKAAGGRARDVDERIPKLIRILAEEEIAGGGWNYANHSAPASFVTAPVAQALLYARGQGFDVPADLLARTRSCLERARAKTGAFLYGGLFKQGEPGLTGDQIQGSIARSAGCEATLVLLGGGSSDAIRGALEAFHEHWSALEDRRKKTGTHLGPYKIAPYYFYYGHRYAAQAIELLPEKERPKERARMLQVILKTRDDDGTWNDRVFPRSRNYGTAMMILALLGEKTPLPPPLKK